jgi:hypothetical protein
MIVYSDGRPDTIRFGLDALTAALEQRGVPWVLRPLCDYSGPTQEEAFVAAHGRRRLWPSPEPLEPEGFALRRQANAVFLFGGDHAGSMYGLLAAAETVRLHGPQALADKVCRPFHAVRGVKFNLPFEPATSRPACARTSGAPTSIFWLRTATTA